MRRAEDVEARDFAEEAHEVVKQSWWVVRFTHTLKTSLMIGAFCTMLGSAATAFAQRYVSRAVVRSDSTIHAMDGKITINSKRIESTEAASKALADRVDSLVVSMREQTVAIIDFRYQLCLQFRIDHPTLPCKQ